MWRLHQHDRKRFIVLRAALPWHRGQWPCAPDADFLVATRGVEGGAGVERGGGGAQGGGGAHRSLAEFIVYLRAGWCEIID